jgi:hypothetical protein
MKTNSENYSQMPRLIFYLEIKGRLPLWNAVLAMGHWQRKKFKDELAQGFLSELRVSESDWLTKTDSARSIMLTYVATLESCLMTRRESARLRQANAKLKKAKKKEPKSKSLK